MKKRLMTPVFFTLWAVVLFLLSYGYMNLEYLGSEGYISSELATSMGMQWIYKGIFVAIIISIGLYFVLDYLIKLVTKPMEKLTDEAKSFAKGEYTHSVTNYEIEEVQLLAQAFDDMGEKLYRTFRKLQYQKTKAESILNSLNEAIIILDTDGYITEQNTYAESLVSSEDMRQTHVLTLLRDPKAARMMERALDKKKPDSCEILKNNKYYHLRVGIIQKGQKHYGFILSIRDITQTRQLEELKYQFVSNVTHELKTPLTSIQGFVETLKEGAIENKDIAMRFLNIIDIESQRLYRLIQDILLLSEIENMDNHHNETVEIGLLIAEVIHLLEQEASKKNIVLKYEEEQPIVLEQVSTDYIKQILVNLISNAIKYTDEGQVTIITAIKDGENQICIKDTGIGIPKESMGRIFERFYRVDKSRSRKSGGTGLGLSIVKHIVELYKGHIEVESSEGVGTSMTIYLPQ